jgi:hypothetical protein
MAVPEPDRLLEDPVCGDQLAEALRRGGTVRGVGEVEVERSNDAPPSSLNGRS